VHKECISNEIREKNGEKKLRSQGLSSDNNSLEQSNSLYDVKTVTIETNSKSANLNIPEISSKSKLPTNLLPNQKIPYNQKIPEFSLEGILTGSAYENRVSDVKSANNIDDQSARTIVYNEIKSLLSDITDVNLHKITSRAKKDIQIQNLINDFTKSSTDMICVTNCHMHVSEPSSSNDISNIEISASPTLNLFPLKKMLSKETRNQVINKLTTHFIDLPKLDKNNSIYTEGEHQTDSYWVL
ncbi:12697_t:CDS:2, partial [Cetraspora pellucida]